MLFVPLKYARKNYAIFSFFLLTFVIFPIEVLSSVSVPNTRYEQKFEVDNYQDILRVYTGNDPSNTMGCVHQWVSNDGWQGSGAAKFYPPTEGQAYCGFGQFLDFNNGNGTEQINVRFLIYHGSEYYQRPKENKLLILNRGELRQRPMIGENWYEDGSWNSIFRAYAPCDNTTCVFDGGQSWPESNERFTIGPKPEHRSEEWVSVELEANVTTGIIRLYIDTQDGALSGLYKEMTFQESPLGEPLFTFIDMIGGYFNFGSPSNPDNYQIFDELVIDDSYIGPPAGFTDEPASNELNVEIEGQAASYEVLSYGGSNQDISGTATTYNNGMAMTLVGNLWKKVDLGSVNIGPNTILEFDFSSTDQGEIHGIGFDNDNSISRETTFKLYGTQRWGRENYADYQASDGTKHYSIPVGQYFTGTYRYLTFVMDNDAGSGESVFSSIVIRDNN
jgi:hypothetical protein